MDKTSKPNFSTNSDVQGSKPFRQEVGAIWEKISKEKQNPFMNIRFRMSKERLQELVNSAEISEDGKVSINFVAFPNRGKEDNPKRPDHRIYEELNRD